MAIPPLYLVADYITSNNPSLPGQFGASVQNPELTGAVLQAFEYNINNGNFSDLAIGLAYMNTSQLVMLTIFPLPPGFPPGTSGEYPAETTTIAGDIYPNAWTSSNKTSYLAAVAAAISFIEGQGFTVAGCTNAQSINSLSPGGGAWGYVYAPSGAPADWIASGWTTSNSTAAAGACATGIRALLSPSSILRMYIFDPSSGIEPGNQQSYSLGVVAASQPLILGDVTWDGGPLETFVAVAGGPFFLQFVTGITSQSQFNTLMNTAIAEGPQWIEVHQGQGGYLENYFLSGDPAWTQGTIYQDGADFTFPNFQKFVYSGGTGMILAPSTFGTGASYYEFVCQVGGLAVAPIAAGFVTITYSGPNPRVTQTTGSYAGVDEAGNIWIAGTNVGSLGVNITTGTVLRVYVDGNGNVAFATSTTNWNGSYTDAQIAAGTGLLSLGTGLLPPFVPFVALDGSGSQSWKIFSSTPHCAFTPISGSAQLPPNSVLTVTGVTCVHGEPAQISWTAGNVPTFGGLQFQLDGGSWNGTNGVESGTSGVATGPTVSNYNVHSLLLREQYNTLDQASATLFTAQVPGVYLGGGTVQLESGSETFAFSSVAQTLVFEGVISSTQSLGVSGTGTISISEDTAGVTKVWFMRTVVSGSTLVFTATDESNFATVSGINTSAPLGATLTVLDANHYTYSLSVNGTVVSGTHSFTGLTGFGAIIPSVSGASFLNNFGASAAIPVYESLTLTTVGGPNAGLLTFGGVSNLGPPVQVDVSLDGGSTWAESTSFSSTTGVNAPFSGNGPTLSLGTFDVQVRDHTYPFVESNVETYVVAESITITSCAGTIDHLAHVFGTANNGPILALDVSINAGSTWQEGTGFTTNGSVTGQTWNVNGEGLDSFGVYPIVVRDHNNTLVLSNTFNYTLSEGSESITLALPTCPLGGTLTLAGFSNNGPPEAQDYSLNNGSTWTPVLNYETGFGPANPPWSGNGGTISTVGTYLVLTRDHANTGVVSNVETLVVSASTEVQTLATVGGAVGGTLSLSGFSTSGHATSLDYSIDNGTTWATCPRYRPIINVPTNSSNWTASGGTLTAIGTYLVSVRDTNEPLVISNTLTLTLQGLETILLQSATGTVGGPVQLAGSTNNGPAEALQVTLDGGITWSNITSYSASSGTLNAPWNAIGPLLGASS